MQLQVCRVPCEDMFLPVPNSGVSSHISGPLIEARARSSFEPGRLGAIGEDNNKFSILEKERVGIHGDKFSPPFSRVVSVACGMC